MALAAVLHRGVVQAPPTAARAAMLATAAAIAVITVMITVGTWNPLAGDPVLQGIVMPAQSLLLVPTWSAMLAIGLWMLVRRVPAGLSVWPAAGVLVAGVLHRGQRSSWRRSVESGASEVAPLVALIPPQAQVYWHLELVPTWALLRRASWVSDAQGSGVVFKRPTAPEFQRRMAPVIAMLQDQASCQMAADVRGQDVECQPPEARVASLCRMPGGPAFMVFDALCARVPVGQWRYRIGPRLPWRTAYLHDCARFRQPVIICRNVRSRHGAEPRQRHARLGIDEDGASACRRHALNRRQVGGRQERTSVFGATPNATLLLALASSPRPTTARGRTSGRQPTIYGFLARSILDRTSSPTAPSGLRTRSSGRSGCAASSRRRPGVQTRADEPQVGQQRANERLPRDTGTSAWMAPRGRGAGALHRDREVRLAAAPHPPGRQHASAPPRLMRRRSEQSTGGVWRRRRKHECQPPRRRRLGRARYPCPYPWEYLYPYRNRNFRTSENP